MAKFVRLLADELLEEGVHIDEETANAALREGVALLPEGSVKNAIKSDFESYSVQLNKLLLRGTKTTTTPNHVSAKRGVAIDEGAVLNEVPDTVNQQNRTEQELSVSACLLTNRGTQLLERYAAKLSNASAEECLAFVSRASPPCQHSHGMWLSWMRFCLTTFSHLVDEVEHGDASRGDIRRRTRELLLKVLLLGHLTKKADQRDREAELSSDDVMSALFSLYVDLVVMESEGVHWPTHLVDVMATILGHSHQHCLDALLQSHIPSDPRLSPALLPVYWRCLRPKQLFSLSVPHWLKAVCCYHRAMHLEGIAQVLPPTDVREWVWSSCQQDGLSEWMWSSSSSICKALGLKRMWSCDVLKDRLFRKQLDCDQLDLLLDLACSHQSVPLTGDEREESKSGVDTSAHDGEESLFFVDHEGEDDCQQEGTSCVEEDTERMESCSREAGQFQPEERPSTSPSLDISRKRSPDAVDGSGDVESPVSAKSKKRKSVSAKSKRTPRRPPAFSPKLLRSVTKKRGLKLDGYGRMVQQGPK